MKVLEIIGYICLTVLVIPAMLLGAIAAVYKKAFLFSFEETTKALNRWSTRL